MKSNHVAGGPPAGLSGEPAAGGSRTRSSRSKPVNLHLPAKSRTGAAPAASVAAADAKPALAGRVAQSLEAQAWSGSRTHLPSAPSAERVLGQGAAPAAPAESTGLHEAAWPIGAALVTLRGETAHPGDLERLAALDKAYRLASDDSPGTADQLAQRRQALLDVRRNLDNLPGPAASPERREALAALGRQVQDLVDKQIRFVERQLASNPFRASRVIEWHALSWEAAAESADQALQAMDDSPSPPHRSKKEADALQAGRAKLEGYRDQFRLRAQALHQEARRLAEAPDGGLDPISRPERSAKPAEPGGRGAHVLRSLKARIVSVWRRGDGGPGPDSYLAYKAHVKEILAGTATLGDSGPFRWNEKKLAIKTLEKAMSDKEVAKAVKLTRAGEDGVSADKPFAARFQVNLSRILNGRANPKVENTVLVPVTELRTDPSTGATTRTHRHEEVVCSQTPAALMTPGLGRSYAASGIRGANCHDATQHQHALNLYRSELRGQDGKTQLSMVRHGVLSTFGLSPKAVRSYSNEHLGRVVLALAAESGDAFLQDLAKDPNTGTPPSARACRLAGAHVRDKSDLQKTLRTAANQQRAREAAQAAVTCLPPAELLRILSAGPGVTPTVRIASVSLLTPDIFRGVKGTSHDERAMWRDQREAWAALAADKGGIELEVPEVDAQGRVAVGDDGMPLTIRRRIHLEVATFNLPVNKEGASALGKLDAVGGLGSESEATHAASLTRMFGRLPEAGKEADWEPLELSWVGAAVKAARESSPPDPAKVDRLLKLSRQVASLVNHKTYIGRADDPYVLVKRLLVLAHETGIVAPAVNCKSGKDRTTEAEAQARQFALEIATTGQVPDLDAAGKEVRPRGKGADLRPRQLWALHQAGGAREIQAWNTGVAGTKLKQWWLFRQYGVDGKPLLQRELMGLSKQTGS